MVPGKGLEPSRLTALVPKTSVSTSSTTRAYRLIASVFYFKFPAIVNIILDLAPKGDPRKCEAKLCIRATASGTRRASGAKQSEAERGYFLGKGPQIVHILKKAIRQETHS